MPAVLFNCQKMPRCLSLHRPFQRLLGLCSSNCSVQFETEPDIVQCKLCTAEWVQRANTLHASNAFEVHRGDFQMQQLSMAQVQFDANLRSNPPRTATKAIQLKWDLGILHWIDCVFCSFRSLQLFYYIFSKCKCLRERNVKKNQSDGHFKWQTRLWPSYSPTLWLIFFGKGEREGAD